MLQTRNAKRPAQAAVRFAVDAVAEGLLTRERALLTIDPGSLDALLHPTFDPQAPVRGARLRGQRVARRGQGRDRVHRRRRGGGRRGGARRDPGAAVHRRRGRRRLPRRQGDPHPEGGKASHAALVARGMGRPAVVGAQALDDRPGDQDGQRQRDRAARGRPDRHRRDQGPGDRRRRAAGRGAASTRTSSRCWSGPTRCAGWTCAPTPTRPRTPRGPASSAPRASGCAGPSTCSWPRTASPRCGR